MYHLAYYKNTKTERMVCA